MPRSGLSKRLQQQSRRSGFAVGLSMVVAIAICFAAFTWIYIRLEPWVQDFAGAEDAPPTATSRPAAESDGDDEEADEPVPTNTPEPEVEVAADTEEEPAIEQAPDDEQESDEFEPDYVMSAGTQVNFRSEPTSAGGGATVIDTLEPGTQLQSTGERAESDSPENGPWMEFRLEDGTEGWLREVDVSPT